MQPEKQEMKEKFTFNKTKVSEFGFNLSSENKLYEELASPFNEEVMKAHPFLAKYPDGFQSFDFQMDKVITRLPQESLFYIFYNVMDEKLQLQAARLLMERNFKYQKHDKVWVRMKEKKFQYFNIVEWQFLQFKSNQGAQCFCTEADFADK